MGGRSYDRETGHATLANAQRVPSELLGRSVDAGSTGGETLRRVQQQPLASMDESGKLIAIIGDEVNEDISEGF